MAEIDATKPQEVQAFLDANGGIAVVDCYATWCGPCKAIAPYVHDKTQKEGIPLVKVNVDEAAELSQAYAVKAMPTFLVISGKWNNVIETVVGGGKANVDKVYARAKTGKWDYLKFNYTYDHVSFILYLSYWIIFKEQEKLPIKRL